MVVFPNEVAFKRILPIYCPKVRTGICQIRLFIDQGVCREWEIGEADSRVSALIGPVCCAGRISLPSAAVRGTDKGRDEAWIERSCQNLSSKYNGRSPRSVTEAAARLNLTLWVVIKKH